MCTYLTSTVELRGSGLGQDGWCGLTKGVVYFDHPQDAPFEHCLCIDFWGEGMARLAVELDAASARRLAETILSTLESSEARSLIDLTA